MAMETGSYIGNGATNRAIPHNLGAVPEQCFIFRPANANQFWSGTPSLAQWSQLGNNAVIAVNPLNNVSFFVSGNANTNAQTFFWTCEADTVNTSTSTTLTLDGQASVYFFGLVLFIGMLYFWRDIFKVDRYE